MGSQIKSQAVFCIFAGLAWFFITIALLSPAWTDAKIVDGVNWFRFDDCGNGTELEASVIRGFTNERVCAYGLCKHTRRQFDSLEGYEKKALGCLLASFLLISMSWTWALLLFCVACDSRIPVPVLIFLGGLCASAALVIYGIHMKDSKYSAIENAINFGYSFFMATGAVFSCVIALLAGIAMVCLGQGGKNAVHPGDDSDGQPTKDELYGDDSQDAGEPVPTAS